MSLDFIGMPRLATTRPAPSVTRHPVASLEHRTVVHPVALASCLECVPAPCPCGRVLCPDAFEHRREIASSETYWIEVAA